MADPIRERWTRVEERLKSMRNAGDEVVEEIRKFRNEARQGFRERKDRIFQARITGSLDKAIREKAREMGAPASKLVRAILEDFLFGDEVNLPPEQEIGSAGALQEVLLAKKVECKACGIEMGAGERAFAPYLHSSIRYAHFFCSNCSMKAIDKDETEIKEEAS